MKNLNRLIAVLAVLVLFVAVDASAAVKDPFDHSNVPIEVQPTHPNALKIVLIAGESGPEHPLAEHEHFGGCALLMRMLQQTPGIASVMAEHGWPSNPETLKNARTVVFYMDGGGKQTTIAHAEEIQKLMDAGVGIVHLHQVIDYPSEPGKQAMEWLGGDYDAASGGARGHWDESFTTFPESPVTRGVGPFKVNDGWILKLRFVPGMKGITPILRTSKLSPKGKPDESTTGTANIVCWTYERPDGGRAFVLTGAHPHKNWGVESFRRLVVNGILWTAKVEVPKAGAPVQLDPEDLMQDLTPKPKKAAKSAKAT